MPIETEVKETWLSPRARRMLNHLIQFLPLLVLAATMALWIDTRYVHKQMSDIRFTNLQIQVLENQVSAYLLLDNPTKAETEDYERVKDRLRTHVEEWNEILGITAK